MILEMKVIEFKGMPLFQKARFKTPMVMEGSILDYACFFYMIEGSMHSYDSRGLHALGEKEAIIKNCNQYIQSFKPKVGADECEVMAVYLYPELLKEIYKDEVPSFLKQEEAAMPKKLIGNQLIEQYVNNLSLYFEEPTTLDEELGTLKLKELIMILLKSEKHVSIRQLLSDIFSPVNRHFQETIQRNLFNPLTLEQLAFICHMSLSTFKREFKKIYDQTPAKYIKNQRLEHAANRLLCNRDPISVIAFESGFQDVTTFSASFQEKFKTSPKNYRLTQIRN